MATYALNDDRVGQPPPSYVPSKGIWLTKLALRILSAILCLPILGLAIAKNTGTDAYFDKANPIFWLVPPAAFTLVWDIVEAICILSRREHRGMHPGVTIPVDVLLCCGGFIPSLVWYGLHYIGDVFYNIPGSNDNYGDFVEERKDAARALFALALVEVFFHIILFIIGSYEAHMRVRSRGQAFVVYAVGQPSSGQTATQPNVYRSAPPPGYIAYTYEPSAPVQTAQPPQEVPGRPIYPPQEMLGDKSWDVAYGNGASREGT